MGLLPVSGETSGDGVWINGGFVLESAIFKYLDGDMASIQWEKKPLIEIANDGQLHTFTDIMVFGNAWMPWGIRLN